MKTKIPKDLKSEAALRWCAENWNKLSISLSGREARPIIYFHNGPPIGDPVAVIDLRDIIRKRQPLTGVKKQVSAIVRGKRKKGKK